MPAFASINGEIFPADQARVSVFDNGFTLGDSVYETLRTYGGKPLHIERHLARLRRSAARLGFDIPLSDAQFRTRVDAVLKRADNPESYMRWIVSRGVGRISYDFDAVDGPTVVILARPLEPPSQSVFDTGITACIVAIRRNSRDAIDPAIKTSSLMNNILAMREAHERGAVEPLLLNASGEVAEGAGSNVFIVKGGELSTPPLEAGILEGITRGLTIEIAEGRGVVVKVQPLRPDDLRAADELFITSTTTELMPVATLDDEPVGDGKPGSITRSLLNEYREYAARTAI